MDIAAIARRLREPSSWAGLSGLLALFGVHLAPDFLQSIILIGAGAAGVISIFVPEKGQPTDETEVH